MDSVIARLISELEVNEGVQFAIIVDGSFLKYKGKMAYVKMITDKVSSEKKLLLFTQSRVVGEALQFEDIPYSFLITKVLSNKLYSIDVDISCKAESVNIDILIDYGIVVIESPLYAAARTVVEAEDNGKLVTGVTIGDKILSDTTIQSLAAEFRRESYRVYGELIYAPGNNRFLNRLMKYQRFYDIQKSFVPVFVNFTGVYNPLNSALSKVEVTKMYQMAVNKNRKLSYSKSLSCLLLTHEEICKCLGMTKFMRFTSNFWYYIFVGLLRTELPGFPRKAAQSDRLNNRLFVLQRSEAVYSNLKSKYTPSEYYELLKELENNYEKEQADTIRQEIRNKLEVLHSYNEVDTLYYACSENFAKLISFGPYQLDSKSITVNNIYDIVCDARLEVGDIG